MHQPSLPLARPTDPDTSRAAALSLVGVNDELCARIRHAVALYGPMTHDQIVEKVNYRVGEKWRWSAGTVKSACARAGLVETGLFDVNDRGSKVIVWDLRVERVNTGDLL